MAHKLHVLLAASTLLALALAGCTNLDSISAEAVESNAWHEPSHPDDETAPREPPGPTLDPHGQQTANGTPTGPPYESPGASDKACEWADDRPPHCGPYSPGWPDLEDARIRPGVRMERSPVVPLHDTLDGCPVNFVFSSPDNRTLYLGAASHCLAGRQVGDELSVAGIEDAATVVYCSYVYVMDRQDCGENAAIAASNDFGLLQVRDALRHEVHPAVLHWGGPTGIGEAPAVGTKVYAYANSPNKPSPLLAPMEGYACDSSAATTGMVLVGVGVPGDSGSPVIQASGEAVGHLMGPADLCVGGGVGPWASNLGPLLAFMEERAGITVQLKTWQILAEGTLP